MRVKRLAVLSTIGAAIAGAMWWKKSHPSQDEEDAVLDLGSSSNGVASSDAGRKIESELSK